jgi:hypothetical protein
VADGDLFTFDVPWEDVQGGTVVAKRVDKTGKVTRIGLVNQSDPPVRVYSAHVIARRGHNPLAVEIDARAFARGKGLVFTAAVAECEGRVIGQGATEPESVAGQLPSMIHQRLRLGMTEDCVVGAGRRSTHGTPRRPIHVNVTMTGLGETSEGSPSAERTTLWVP